MPISTTTFCFVLSAAFMNGSGMYSKCVQASSSAECAMDDDDNLTTDMDFMESFRRGVDDLNAGRVISAEDLERELGL